MKRFAMLLLLAACGGSAADHTPITTGEICGVEGVAICERGAECGLITQAQIGDCQTQARAICCGNDGTCGVYAPDPVTAHEELDRCEIAFRTENCQSLAAGQRPAECSNL